jgi:hypothetical protein
MNDATLKDFGCIAISEPNAFLNSSNRVRSVPEIHRNWSRFIPTCYGGIEARWPIRSMLWIRKDLEVEHLAIQSPDLTAALIHLPDCKILIVSVYIPQGTEALLEEIELIRALINTTCQRIGTRTDIVLAGDFNRHDQLGEATTLLGKEKEKQTLSSTSWLKMAFAAYS